MLARHDVSVSSKEDAQSWGLLPEQTQHLHWWVRPKAHVLSRVEALASELGLSLPQDIECLGRLVAELVAVPELWYSYSRKPFWYSKWAGLLPKWLGCRCIVRVMDRLRDAGLVQHHMGYHTKAGDGWQSRVRAMPRLLTMFVVDDTEADPNAPLVIVKDEDGFPCPPSDELEFARHCRKVGQLREWMRSFVVEAPAQPGRMELRQIFNSAELDKGGRYYGWWQNLSKSERLRIKLNGSPVCELDFGQNHPSFLYHGLGLDVPVNAYEVTGFSRDLAKATFNRMLNTSLRGKAGMMTTLGRELGSYEEAKRLVLALLEIHAPLVKAGKFWSGIGHKLMRMDATVAEHVLTWARLRGVPILPVHDSFVVPVAYADETRRQMEQSYSVHMGVQPVVKRSNPDEPLESEMLAILQVAG